MPPAQTKAEALADPARWVADILKCSEEEVTDDAGILTHPRWDSFAQLEIMLGLAERFGVEFTEETISRYSAFANIRRLFEERAGRSG